MTPTRESRERIAENYFHDESHLVRTLAERARMTVGQNEEVMRIAEQLVAAARTGRRKFGGVDAFMHEYSLSSEEGVVLMCMAEALLRIPDEETIDQLIADKIGGRDWQRHVGESDSLFVNASTWGLMLTGQVIDLGGVGGKAADTISGKLKQFVNRSGEPVIRQAMRQAMRILGKQFVLGRTIKEALNMSKAREAEGYRFSYDMLGEAAMTAKDAIKYYAAYEKALAALAKKAGPLKNGDIFARPSLSVKLSAIHPRYEAAKETRDIAELVPQLKKLALAAKEAGLGLTVDAEEADRLDISLEIFGRVLADSDIAGWDGFGLAVQAYGRRALPVLEWLASMAQDTGHVIPVRLVKGAYWDSEIKHAQEEGHESYPVFTRKSSTDVSYLACSRYLLEHGQAFFPQFATHNAHTIAAVMVMAGDNTNFEFQRLHGMGQALYEDVVPADKFNRPCRIYAPVGSHEDLLAYLVRRLLENGANTSFVNRLADDDAPINEIIGDPVARVSSLSQIPHPKIPAPSEIFQPHRGNSRGLVLTEKHVREPLMADMRASLESPQTAAPIVGGKVMTGEGAPVRSPQDNRIEVGTVIEASADQIEKALQLASNAAHDWDRLGGRERAIILRRAAGLYEENRAALMALMVQEAGKTLSNALADLREAIDFLYYYATQAEQNFASTGTRLPGITGEENTIYHHGRGVFVCISPWNFPLAIFTGQLAAALAAGNAAISKPAEQTPLVAAMAIRLLHEAGIPGDVLHLLPGRGDVVGARLIEDRRVSGVAFTGSNETASLIHNNLSARGGPIVPLIAETGGMNAMIVDSSALPEQVVGDSVRSAFDSAGQRCSALRVLFLQEDNADKILTMLLGAMEELEIGDPFQFSTDVGPVIDAEAKKVLDAHKAAMKGAYRELIDLPLPEMAAHGTFVSPAAYEIDGINVLEREVFGPVMHVVRYRSDHIDKVCDAINETGYGLTLGIHSRIDTRIDDVISRVRVGNIYVNRNQVGAVVGSQPFGGEGLSGTGPKAGGPRYLTQFSTERVVSEDTTASGGNAALMTLGSGDVD